MEDPDEAISRPSSLSAPSSAEGAGEAVEQASPRVSSSFNLTAFPGKGRQAPRWRVHPHTRPTPLHSRAGPAQAASGVRAP